jgi:hypothetical protein
LTLAGNPGTAGSANTRVLAAGDPSAIQRCESRRRSTAPGRGARQALRRVSCTPRRRADQGTRRPRWRLPHDVNPPQAPPPGPAVTGLVGHGRPPGSGPPAAGTPAARQAAHRQAYHSRHQARGTGTTRTVWSRCLRVYAPCQDRHRTICSAASGQRGGRSGLSAPPRPQRAPAIRPRRVSAGRSDLRDPPPEPGA